MLMNGEYQTASPMNMPDNPDERMEKCLNYDSLFFLEYLLPLWTIQMKLKEKVMVTAKKVFQRAQ